MAEWREISGYEGLYLVSDKGEIVALPKVVRGGAKLFHRKAKPIKQGMRKNYPCVNLCDGKSRKTHSVHRLVATAFIPNPNGLPEVNHKDENTRNNCVENLEWCTRQYNIEYSKCKAVRQISGDSCIGEYKSILEASEKTGIGRKSINNALRGWSTSAGGYQWKYCEQ